MNYALGFAAGLGSAAAWIFLMACVMRGVLNRCLDAQADGAWWCFPIYMAVMLPLAIICVAGIVGCLAPGVMVGSA